MKTQIHRLPAKISISEEILEKLCQDIAEDIELEAGSCAIIFTDDAELKEMHAQYLQDPTETDVITFNLGEDEVEGEIYISADRAVEQAAEFSVSPEEEVLRLVVHGLLHLKGYDDLAQHDRMEMKKLENQLVEKYVVHLKKK